MPTGRNNTPEDVWRYIDRRGPDECWPWRHPLQTGSYPVFCLGGKHVRAGRVVYAMTHGEVPDGLELCHTCDNPHCCNPAHLFPGTMKDNMDDMAAKGRQRWGEKFTPEQVRLIRQMVSSGVPQTAIMREFHISQPHVSAIVNRRRRNTMSYDTNSADALDHEIDAAEQRLKFLKRQLRHSKREQERSRRIQATIELADEVANAMYEGAMREAVRSGKMVYGSVVHTTNESGA